MCIKVKRVSLKAFFYENLNSEVVILDINWSPARLENDLRSQNILQYHSWLLVALLVSE